MVHQCVVFHESHDNGAKPALKAAVPRASFPEEYRSAAPHKCVIGQAMTDEDFIQAPQLRKAPGKT
jgi:hypothetical protein